MRLEQLLASCLPAAWVVRQAIILDWHDGPREGICALSRPVCCFYFKVIAERFIETESDDRLFQIDELPDDTIAKVLLLLAELGSPCIPVWAPIWRFPTDNAQMEVERQLDFLLTKRTPVGIIIQTSDMIHFKNYWKSSSVIV